MQPIYIPESNRIIRSDSEKYIHPVTMECYGRTDFSDPAKIAEIGAVPLVEVDDPHTDDMVNDSETLTVTANQATLTRKWRARTPAEAAAMAKAQAAFDLQASDAGTVRVIEDLVDTLIAKGVIVKADLPAAARKKLDDRKALRAVLSK